MSIPSEQLEQQIQTILKGDNAQRKLSEQTIAQFREQNPDQFIQLMLELLFSSQLKQVREFCGVSLRKNLSEFSEKSYQNLWGKLQQQTKQLFKEKIVCALQNEQDKDVRRKLADTIGEIGASVFSSGSAQEWTELIPTIWQLLNNNDVKIIESGLKVLSTLLMYEVDQFQSQQEELKIVFTQGIANQNIDIQLATCDAISSYMENIDFGQIKKFEQLAGPMVQCMFALIKNDVDKGEELLENIGEICESAPSFFKKDSKIFFDCMNLLTFDKSLEEHIRRLATENALLLAERVPKLVKSEKAILSMLLEMIISHMVDISQTIDGEWEKPKEGFSEDIEEDAEYESVRFGTNGIDRMISSVGSEIMLPLVSQVVQKMLQQQDWRYVHAAIMALSQVGEYIENIDEIQPIITLVTSYAQNQNSKIRYSVCHCIGQIADDVEEFGDKFSSSLFPILFNLLEDPVPRVQSHAAAAITNFVEQMDEEVIKPYLGQILERSTKLLQSSISIVKETVLAAIAATSEACKTQLHPYYASLMELLFEMMGKHTTNEYKQLRGQIIESMTLMGHSVGKEQFATYQDRVIQMMLQLQEGGISEGTDPQKSYLLSGWQRIAITLGKDFSKYLPSVIPAISNMIQKLLLEGKGELEGAVSVNTNQTEELEVAVNMLGVIVDEIGEGMGQWLEQIFLILINLVNFEGNESVKVSAMKGLEGCIEASPQQSKLQVGKQILSAIFTCIDKEFSTGVLEEAMYTVKEALEAIPEYGFTQQEISEIVTRAMKVLVDSDKRKGENEQNLHGAELDEDQKEVFEEEQEGESELQLAVAQVFGSIFKMYKEYCNDLVETLYNQILPKVLVDTVSVKTQQFGLYIVDDMLEHLGPQKLQGKMEVLSNILDKYAAHPNAGCRQAACYGIGLFATYKEIMTNELVQKYLIKINDALKIKKEQDKEYGHARDNIVSALGKIIKNHSEKINVKECVQLWLNQLPLKNDKIEAKGMHQLLTEIIEANSLIVFGDNNENLPKIIKIFGEILGTKYINEETKKKIAVILQTLKNNQFIIENWNSIIDKLTNIQQKRLHDCINQQ